MNNTNEKIILTPEPSRIMEGLRDTGYSFNVSMADLIDNSIAAGASTIDVKLNLDPSNKLTVYVADDGCGMDLDGLKNAMIYGSKEREDKKSLGKFGLGLKTASTAFCRSLSVLSKTENGEYYKVCWDLDYVEKVKNWELLTKEVDDDEVEYLETITNGKSGTLVIWNKVDRLLSKSENSTSFKKAYNRTICSLKDHIAMVYQRYIDKEFYPKGLVIKVNDEIIEPWDPFCRNEINREVVSEGDMKVILPDGNEGSFHLCAVVLPRPEDWSSIEAHKKADISNKNEGFYVYRENRLIYHGDWMGMYISEPHVALLRVELSFDYQLDELFNVDIKKSRIILNEDIFDHLKTKFLPSPRNRAIEVYNSASAKKAKDKAKTENKHKLSNITIEEKSDEIISSAVEIINKSSGEVKIKNNFGESLGVLKILDIADDSELRVIPVDKEDDVYLWEPSLANEEHSVLINTRHPFYYKVYAKIEDRDVIAGIDYLLWSLAEAELSTYTASTKRQYEDMRYQVSSKLKTLVESLPEVINIEEEK